MVVGEGGFARDLDPRFPQQQVLHLKREQEARGADPVPRIQGDVVRRSGFLVDEPAKGGKRFRGWRRACHVDDVVQVSDDGVAPDDGTALWWGCVSRLEMTRTEGENGCRSRERRGSSSRRNGETGWEGWRGFCQRHVRALRECMRSGKAVAATQPSERGSVKVENPLGHLATLASHPAANPVPPPSNDAH